MTDFRKYLLGLYHRHAWQPFTQMKLAGNPLLIKAGQGACLIADDDRAIIDATGSWWVNIHGHSHPEIAAAIQEQAGRLEHVMYAAFAHEPALRLGAELSALTDHNLSRVFYSDNGSTAVEVALKMAFQFFHNQGWHSKHKIVSLEGAYHGDTIGAMSVGARLEFHALYSPFLFPCQLLPLPEISYGDFQNEKSHPGIYENALNEIQKTLHAQKNEIAALIVEPLLQGAGGMRLHAPYFLKQIYRICQENNILMIADEVFTGFGRTGSMFACQRAGFWPDLLCLSKALTAGFLPMAVTLAREPIYQAFYSDNRQHTFFHGHSMTANPLACAAALKSLEIYNRDDRAADVLRIEKFHESALARLQEGKLRLKIKETRCLGSVSAIELKAGQAYTGNFAPAMIQASLARGVSLRPLGGVVYVTPPYIISNAELEKVYEVMEEAIEQALGAST